jgi:hypothetical protein
MTKKSPTDHQIRQQTSSLSYNPTNPNPTLSPISTIFKTSLMAFMAKKIFTDHLKKYYKNFLSF